MEKKIKINYFGNFREQNGNVFQDRKTILYKKMMGIMDPKKEIWVI